METQENRLNKEPRLCVVRRFEGLIVSAESVKAKRRGRLHPMCLVVVMLIATKLFGKRGGQTTEK